MVRGIKGTKSARGTQVVKVAAASGRRFTVAGLTSAKGDRWVEVRSVGQRGYAPYRDFRGSALRAIDRLSENGIVLIGTESNTVRDAVPKITSFPNAPLIEQPGWSGVHFGLPSGQVFSPKGSPEPVVLFAPEPQKCASAGTGRAWLIEVCKPLAGQLLCEFMMMATLAAPLLSQTRRVGNFGFELVGEAAIGKSTLQYLMATIAGPGVRGSGGHYWIDCNTTVNALEETMTLYADQPLIMDEAALFASAVGGDSRSNSWKELVFKLAGGTSKSRFSLASQAEHRFVYFISSNRSTAEIIGHRHEAELNALQDRLITLRIDDDDRPLGIFDRLPSEYASPTDFADALKQAAQANYGHALPRFLRHLIRRQTANSALLEGVIQKRMVEFRKVAAVNLADGSDTRVVDAFGLAYAAGVLAQEFGVLPRSFSPLRASVAAITLHRRERLGRRLLRLPERLMQLSTFPGVIDLDQGLPRLTNAEMQGPRIFLGPSAKARREILFNQAARDLHFPDFRAVLEDPDNRQWFKSDGLRKTSRRKVRSGMAKDAVYRFFLPPCSGSAEEDDWS